MNFLADENIDQQMIDSGVLLIRLAGLSPTKKSEIISSVIASHGEEFLGKFTVISPGMVRIRRNNESA